MIVTVLSWVLTQCIEGSIICERGQVPTVKYYEPGKACYIEGVFYESCPPRN